MNAPPSRRLLGSTRLGWVSRVLPAALALGWRVAAGTEPALTSPAPFRPLRYDEDYRALRDPAARIGFWDPLKFIPLDDAADAWLTFGGEVRERYEYFRHSGWGRGVQDDDGYVLQRYQLHGDAHFGEGFRVFTQFKSGLESGREGGPRPTDRDDFDLHQAFLDVPVFSVDAADLTLRVGRQELAFGSSRLVSFRESPNVRLSFDGARLLAHWAGVSLDLVAMRPVRTRVGVFDDDPDPRQALWGLYTTVPLTGWPGTSLDFYYLGVDRMDARFDQGRDEERRHSLGTRWWGRRGRWDFNVEGLYQGGHFGAAEIQAWTVASDTGFTLTEAPGKPRLGFRANVTSGDGDRADARLETFNPLFPRGAYFGEPALIGPANHMDLHPSLELALGRPVTLRFDWDVFWRTSLDDGIYGPAVNLLQSGAGSRARFIGHQAEVMLEWRVDRHLVLTADFAHFFAGGFLRETTPGKDVDYLSVWATYRF